MLRVPRTKVDEAQRSMNRSQRLEALVKSMAQEIERLTEDNVQLRAATMIYREVVQRLDSAQSSRYQNSSSTKGMQELRIA